MNQLTTFNQMTSMQIAEVTGKLHHHIIRDIKDEIEKLENAGVPTETKFGLSERQDSTGRKIPYYILTKEGVLQLAARYDAVVRAKLIELTMRQDQQIQLHNLSPQLQLLINIETEQRVMKQQLSEYSEKAKAADIKATEVKQELQGMRDIITLDTRSWREDTSRIINKIAQKLGGNEHIRDVRTEAYKLLDKRFGVSIETRLTNLVRRMAEQGVCKSRRDKANHLDVIAEDKKLIEGFVAIVKEMAVKHGVGKGA